MNTSFLFLYSMLFCTLISCGTSNKPSDLSFSISKTDTCSIDSKNTYEVYIPKRENKDDKLPLLVIIDAHGSGKFALERFKLAANKYQAILVASNYIKNGFPDYERTIQTLIDDARKKYPIGDMTFITGFSGGARMALGYAQNHKLSGLILCGALANANQINSIQCPIISISGTDDFNFMETAQYLFQEQSIPNNLKIELINASHNWPDSLILAHSLGFLRLSSTCANIPTLEKSELNEFCKKQQSRIDTLQQQGDFLKAAIIARNMSSTQTFDNDKSFATVYDNLKSNSNYINQLNNLGKCINFEMSVRQPYIDALQTKDTIWWKNEIDKLHEKIDTEQDSFIKDTYRRIHGFWGIACYSVCKQAVKTHNTNELTKIVSIYKMLEPENPDMFYFSAFLYLWKNDNEATISTLKKAISLGFSDMNQLKKDFPETISLNLN